MCAREKRDEKWVYKLIWERTSESLNKIPAPHESFGESWECSNNLGKGRHFRPLWCWWWFVEISAYCTGNMQLIHFLFFHRK